MQNIDPKIKELAEILWKYHHTKTVPLPKADLILGLGSYDLRVAEYCAKLHNEKYAPFILFSGKDGNWTRGVWEKTEAETFKDYAVSYGVSPQDILTENEATNIGENISKCRMLLAHKNIEVNKVILVTKPNTLRRALATALKKWPEIKFVASSPDLKLSDQITENHSWDAMINEMVGDLQRIKLYPKLGFQVKQDIPKNVNEAYSKLVKLGFDKHLIKPKTLLEKIRWKIQDLFKG